MTDKVEYLKEYYQKNKEQLKARRMERWEDEERDRDIAWQKTPRGRASRLIAGAKSRAASKNIEFNLDIDWLTEKIEGGFCEVTMRPFILDEQGGGSRPFSPSLDRKDPVGPYTKDNVQVTTWLYNRAKGVYGHDAVLEMSYDLVYKDLESQNGQR